MSVRDEMSIVAGGWSFSQVDQHRLPGVVVGVNDSALLLPRSDIIISMDRLWMENRFAELCRLRRMTYLRNSAANKHLDLSHKPWIITFSCDHETAAMSDRPFQINGLSSGHCALNLAYHRMPRKLYLFGFDMKRGPKGEAHWHEDYAWRPGGATTGGKFKEWAQSLMVPAAQFKSAGIDVYNVTTNTDVRAFEIISPEDLGILKT